MHYFKSLVIIMVSTLLFFYNVKTVYSYENVDNINNNSEIMYSCDYGYNLLNNDSKTIYSKLKAACENFDIDIPPNQLGNALIVKTDDIDLSYDEKIIVLKYFLYDNPQYFWLDNMHGISDNTISLACNKKYYTKSSRDNAWNTIKEVINGYMSYFNKANLKNDYEKEKFIHDIIINNTTPCKSSWNPNEYYKSTIEGVFGEFRTADSLGYGKAFVLLMNATNQSSIFLKCFCTSTYMASGTCAVNIDDNWYCTDVYRDDVDNSPSTDFLNFSNTTFNEQYIISSQPSLTAPFSYELPQISDTKYELVSAKKPVFTLNLNEKIQINQGQDIALTVNVASYDDVIFEWYKDGEIIEGENSDTLILNSIKEENSGTYQVCAIRKVGDITKSELSDECLVNVLTPIKITSDLEKSMLLKEGDKVTLSVSAQGESPLSFKWYKDDVILENQTDDNLTFESLTKDDEGNFFVEIIDANMQTVKSSICNVLIDNTTPLEIITNLDSSQLEYEGSPVILYVLAQGNDPLIYKWFKDDVLIKNKNENYIIMSNTCLSDTGKYKVIITDSLQQTIQSAVCNLIIIKNPLQEDTIVPNQEEENNDELLDNITVPVIKLKNLDTIYKNANSKSNSILKCAEIYYNKELSKAIKATVSIDTSKISTAQLGNIDEFNSNIIKILKSIASLNIDNPTRSFELFSKRFDNQGNFNVLTFSKDMDFPFPVEVTFTLANNDLDKSNNYFYYFDDDKKTLELCEKTSISNNTFKVQLSHCCEYIISPKQINILPIDTSYEPTQEIDDTANPNTSQTKDISIIPILVSTALCFIIKFKK